MTIADWLEQPAVALPVTLGAYVFGLWLNRRYASLHPLFVCSLLLIGLLLLLNVPYASYRQGTEALVFILGPATVALGVPLYKNARSIGRHALPIAAGITVGSISALLLSAALVWSLGGSVQLMLSMMPKSVTTPVAVEISRQAGGIPELTTVLTVLTGLMGSMFGPALLKLAGVRDDISLGTAMGTGSHGIGTARMLRDSELAGSVSGFAMGAAAILTSVLFVPLYMWLS
ncbi:LrgB family protein [Paenibacillus sp. YYML68]|uniref:LrgB family protein n=1 Tax=Paenibacillus sp. YYML68 TaxID=2909250 RepID=UPI002490DC5B|nr:LrgB family protein [Paenibacillus sp. YYML68]